MRVGSKATIFWAAAAAVLVAAAAAAELVAAAAEIRAERDPRGSKSRAHEPDIFLDASPPRDRAKRLGVGRVALVSVSPQIRYTSSTNI